MKSIPDSLLKRHRQWIDIVNKGDVDRYAGLLTDDAVWIPPGQEPIRGPEAFKNWLSPFMKQYRYEFTISDERFLVSGNRALERARFRSEMISRKEDGRVFTHSGTFTVFWYRDDKGQWYIERYIDDTGL